MIADKKALQKRHMNRLIPSDNDMMHLCAAVVNNYNELLESHRRIRGTDLLIPTDLESCRNIVVRLKNRYEGGDFRHSEGEKQALRQFAQWTVIVNKELRGQTDILKPIQWKD